MLVQGPDLAALQREARLTAAAESAAASHAAASPTPFRQASDLARQVGYELGGGRVFMYAAHTRSCNPRERGDV